MLLWNQISFSVRLPHCLCLELNCTVPKLFRSLRVDLYFFLWWLILVRLVVESLWFIDFHTSVITFRRFYLSLSDPKLVLKAHFLELIIGGLEASNLRLLEVTFPSLIIFIANYIV